MYSYHTAPAVAQPSAPRGLAPQAVLMAVAVGITMGLLYSAGSNASTSLSVAPSVATRVQVHGGASIQQLQRPNVPMASAGRVVTAAAPAVPGAVQGAGYPATTSTTSNLTTNPRLIMGLLVSSIVAAAAMVWRRTSAPVPALAMYAATGEEEKEQKDDGSYVEPEAKPLTIGGLVQLIMAGAGAPVLGELKEINLDDPDKPDFVFELESNNLTDAKGESLQTKNPYFNEGWSEEEEDGPGFFENLMSGGRLQEEFEARKRAESRQASEEE